MNSLAGEVTARILIVDDHRISRQFLAAALRQYGMDVKQAATATRARSIALAWLPDVVLIDVQLGADSGFDLARQLIERWNPAVGLPKVLMLTAETPRCRQLHRSRNPGFRVLHKPVDLQYLLRIVQPQAAARPASPEAPSRPGLRTMFREELLTQLPVLEEALGGRDLPRARAVLHNLIASSGLSGEHHLEQRLRSLYVTCDRKMAAPGLAGDYYLLLNCAQRFLETMPASDRV